jgi:menaquinone-dependent protoporphyrinogen oxidase
MAKFLLVYGSDHGQTAKIAKHIAKIVRDKGHTVVLVPGNELPAGFSLDEFAGVIIGASIHTAKHQKYIVDFVKANLATLQTKPAAFFSVSISAASSNNRLKSIANDYLVKFVRETGWRPAKTGLLAGALLYTKYSLIQKYLLRFVTRNSVGATDVNRDYEYTDWEAVTKFAESYLTLLEPVAV